MLSFENTFKSHGMYTMKKMILLACLALLGLPALAQNLFTDGFESGDFKTGQWMPTGNLQISTDQPASGLYCALGEGSYGLNKILTNLNQAEITLEFKVRPGQTSTNCMIFRIRDSSHAAANTGPGIILRNDAQIIGINGGGQGNQVSLDVYNENQWYHFKLLFHMRSGTYDIYIDGQLKAKDFKFFSRSFLKPYFMTWNSIETSGNARYDDFLIYETGTTATHQASTQSAQLLIYPNPTPQTCKVMTHDCTLPIAFKVIDAFGRSVQTGTSTSPTFDLDLQKLLPGIYTLQIQNPPIFQTFVKGKNEG